jgi:hypothetical protein
MEVGRYSVVCRVGRSRYAVFWSLGLGHAQARDQGPYEQQASHRVFQTQQQEREQPD